MTFEFSVPVLVVGGGACGCVAALAARDAGAEVLLIEADARPLGSTGMTLGLVCAADTKAQAAAGIEDSADAFFEDIMAKSRGLANPVIARALAEQSGPALDWLAQTHDFPLEIDLGFRPAYGNRTYRMHGWPGHGGEDLVGLLHRRLAEAGVDVLLQAKLADVVADENGKVLGAVIERPGGDLERVGCDTLILACGGFAANRAMLVRYIPEMADARNNGHEGSQGTGIRIGEALGAAIGDMGSYQGYAMLTDPQGISVSPQVLVEGGVLVNSAGLRFTDETKDIAGMVHPVMAQDGGTVWTIYDERIEEATAYTPDMQALNALNAAKRAASAEILAAQIGVPTEALSASLADACSARNKGAADSTGRVWGEELPPHGSLRALKVVGAIYHTQGGLEIDGHARVLRPDDTPLPNLFAGGGAARSVSGPSSWGYLPAMGLCTAVTLGRIAGMSAAKQALHPTDR
ncbi:FAD-dependent oxidoreductase [Novosphingobium sp.]|uniref:FAD-dependent oxidoreductase n=1 Tax=Novosphingobium sp. TaxID=1874826 RepID=UPI00286D6C8B|nr:FAD-dependent oxidoreductase [Novosphingobium sp.]